MMRFNIVMCDFCKNLIAEEKVKLFSYNLTRIELCENCYEKANEIRKKYEDKVSGIDEEYKTEIEKMKKI